MTSTTSPLERGVVDSLIVAPALLGLVWLAKEWFAVGRINVLLPPDQKHKNDEPLLNKSEQLQNMNEISSIFAAGAKSFLKAEYLYMAALDLRSLFKKHHCGTLMTYLHAAQSRASRERTEIGWRLVTNPTWNFSKTRMCRR